LERLVRKVGVVADIGEQVVAGEAGGVQPGPELAVDRPSGAAAPEGAAQKVLADSCAVHEDRRQIPGVERKRDLAPAQPWMDRGRRPGAHRDDQQLVFAHRPP
jgi:hypothetical protein